MNVDNEEIKIIDNKLVCTTMQLTEIIGVFPASLRVLCLYDNQLTSLPDSIGNLTNLSSLYIHSLKVLLQSYSDSL